MHKWKTDYSRVRVAYLVCIVRKKKKGQVQTPVGPFVAFALHGDPRPRPTCVFALGDAAVFVVKKWFVAIRGGGCDPAGCQPISEMVIQTVFFSMGTMVMVIPDINTVRTDR